MTERCHLSGLPIDVDNPIIALPVRFGSVTEYALCYQSEREAQAFALPTTGNLGEFGGFSADTPAMRRLIKHVEKNLYHNDPMLDKKGFSTSIRYMALAEEKSTTTALPGEFCEQASLIRRAYGEDVKRELLPLKTITGPAHMMELLRRGSLANVSGGNVYHLTYILIDRTFFNGLIDEHYGEIRDTLKTDLTALFFNDEKLALDKDDWCQWSYFELENELFSLLPLSGSSQPRPFIKNLTLRMLDAYKKSLGSPADMVAAKEVLTVWIDDIILYSLIQLVYSDLGRTFYPQAMRSNPKRQHDFTTFLLKQQEARRDEKSKEYSPENGYEEETQARYQWS